MTEPTEPTETSTATLLRRALQSQAAAKYRERSAARTLEDAGKAIDMLQADLAEVTRQRDTLRAACEFGAFALVGVADKPKTERPEYIAIWEQLLKAQRVMKEALAQCPRPAQTGVADAAGEERRCESEQVNSGPATKSEHRSMSVAGSGTAS